MNTDRWLIHRHLAQHTDERLQLVRKAPQHILLAGADADISRSLLASRYPKATFSEYDLRATFLEAAAARRKNGLLARLSGKIIPQHHQSMTDPFPEACADFLWANLSLITAPELPPVFRNWAQALKPDGLLFFTHFGIDSLQSLYACLKTHGIEVSAPSLVDMHDLGDMLLENGFYDPITDTSKLELSYASAASFWQDMEILGIWNALSFSDPDAARRLITQAIEAGNFSITLETIYGHAVKKAVLPEGASPVQFYPKVKGEQKAKSSKE
ncbi:MAG: class I SAM-dependent methyltransferase [Neisseria sp.]|uniref:class I SAM-dependent methyltransferase n=1 Tax=Neisseria sp. TaxID=192066 RepID=UPI0026DBA1E1|nr:class I SAM-dependent methyltransferase [Neisseria sp.]MDO4640245.1 class I SAM-dependent methyltransferase [Neisseria sp.]